MKATLLDLATGRTAMSAHDVSVFQWTENNWSCDCNRALAFGLEPFAPEVGDCLGSRRFLVIDCHGDLEGMSVDEIRKEANRGYFGGTKQADVGR